MVSSKGVMTMYNQEIKTRFIEEHYPSSRKGPNSAFNRLERFEVLMGKDVAEMTRAEAVVALSGIPFSNKSSIASFKSILRKYVIWCRNNRVFEEIPGGIEGLEPTQKDVNATVNELYFRDETDFLRSLKKVCKLYFVDGRISPLIAVLTWLGLKKSEIIVIEDSDVDLEGRIIRNQFGDVVSEGYSDEIAEILRLYDRCNVAERSNKNGPYPVYKDRSHPVFVKKYQTTNSDSMGETITEKNVTQAFQDLNEVYVELGYGRRFTHSNVHLSGCLYRLYKLEESGVDVFDEKNEGLVCTVFRNTMKYKSILWRYNAYKKAFNI